ncbi:unnamed protein product [Nesidiocoris tenuis]|uniref:Uncharacterized protein n=1 Tax=Nesidiocoris tenuis TaxID=355587 RepID=A0A6H5G793_9HEMI|nr:unnamed protein product [Nesidiocoris tenuis]
MTERLEQQAARVPLTPLSGWQSAAIIFTWAKCRLRRLRIRSAMPRNRRPALWGPCRRRARGLSPRPNRRGKCRRRRSRTARPLAPTTRPSRSRPNCRLRSPPPQPSSGVTTDSFIRLRGRRWRRRPPNGDTGRGNDRLPRWPPDPRPPSRSAALVRL